MNLEDFTILLQGKIFKETSEYAKYYKNLGFKVHLSSYEKPNFEVDNFLINNINDINILQNKTGSTLSGKYQIFTTLFGLKTVDTIYTIKIRTDECYRLDNIINLFLQNDEKIVFHNLYYRPPYREFGNFHISDKLLIGKTINLIKMFDVSYKFLTEGFKENYYPPCVEDLLGYSYVRENLKNNIKIQNLMQEKFDFINFTELAPFQMRFNSVDDKIRTEKTLLPEFNNKLWSEWVKEEAYIYWK